MVNIMIFNLMIVYLGISLAAYLSFFVRISTILHGTMNGSMSLEEYFTLFVACLFWPVIFVRIAISVFK